MKTDTLFHEYFQTAPEAVFELLQMQPGCAYTYTSPVVKASERRLDGFLEPQHPDEPFYFVEIHGYSDPLFYWRYLSRISLAHEQTPALVGKPWQAIVFFLDKSYDPGPSTLAPLYPARNGRDGSKGGVESATPPDPVKN